MQRFQVSNVMHLIRPVSHPLSIYCLAFAMFFGASHAQVTPPVPPSPPLLACAGGPTTVADDVEFRLQASCSQTGRTTNSKSKRFTGWLTTGLVQGVDAKCPHAGPLGGGAGNNQDDSHELTGEGNASIARICVGLPNAATKLFVSASVSALAGYELSSGCDGGNYCSAAASLAGHAATSFQVNDAQVNQWCLSISKMEGTTVAAPGYPGSSGFPHPGTSLTNYAKLYNPTGQLLNLQTGATYLLNQAGAWKIQFPISKQHSSQMTETSGSFTVTQDLVIVFQLANANGTCPNVQFGAAAKAK
jgi:hypothetical protein